MAENFSLAKRCLEAIAESIALRSKDVRLNDGFVYPNATFSQLSDSTIQEILDLAFSKEILSPEYFACLIHKDVLKLDLSRYVNQQLISDQVLLQLPCKELVSLNICGLEVSSSILNMIIQNLTRLTCINLSQCNGCSDSVLENLAKNCPNLKDLNFERCRQITDHGIDALLKPTDSSVGPLKIAYLNVSSTSVTTKSLWMLMSNLVPQLFSLSFAKIKNTGKSVADRTMFMKVKIGQLPLQYLDMSGTRTGFNQLKLILESCPHLIELKLTIPFYTNVHTEPFSESLKNLSQLKSLDISIDYTPNSGPPPRPFPFERIESFLQDIGQQLEILNLAGPMELKLLLICLHCKSLKQLVLYECEMVHPFLPSLGTLPIEDCEDNTECNIAMFSDFCSLRYMHLERVQFNHLSLHEKQEILYELLTSHSNLLQLSLKSVPIEEKVLIRILQSSSGNQLEKLVLSCYDNITTKTIHVIKETCPSLKRLELHHCWVITWYDIWQINELFKRNGSRLEVDLNVHFTCN